MSRMGDLNGKSEYIATCSPKQKKTVNNFYCYFSLQDYSATYQKDLPKVMMKLTLFT